MPRKYLCTVLMAAAALAGCGSGKDDAPVVYAAASLRDVLAGIDAGARYDFAGSGDLALRIEHGAPADLFLSAGPKDPQALFAAGRCERPVAFATNVLVLLVPARGAVRDVADLRRGRRRLAVAATGVPAGDYTRALLTRLGLSSILRTNRVSDETSVAGVTSKVALGSADAGFAYATDARVAGDRVRAVALPASAQPPIRYEGCVVRREGARATAARTVLRRLTSADGRAALRRAGFGLP